MTEAVRVTRSDDLLDWERDLMDHANWDLERIEYVAGTPSASRYG